MKASPYLFFSCTRFCHNMHLRWSFICLSICILLSLLQGNVHVAVKAGKHLVNELVDRWWPIIWFFSSLLSFLYSPLCSRLQSSASPPLVDQLSEKAELTRNASLTPQILGAFQSRIVYISNFDLHPRAKWTRIPNWVENLFQEIIGVLPPGSLDCGCRGHLS